MRRSTARFLILVLLLLFVGAALVRSQEGSIVEDGMATAVPPTASLTPTPEFMLPPDAPTLLPTATITPEGYVAPLLPTPSPYPTSERRDAPAGLEIVFEESFDQGNNPFDQFNGAVAGLLWQGEDYALNIIDSDAPVMLAGISLADVVIETTVVFTSGSFRLNVRQWDTNAYSFVLDLTGSLTLSRNGVLISSTAIPVTAGQPYTLRVSVIGAEVRAALDEIEHIVFVDPDPLPMGDIVFVGHNLDAQGLQIDDIGVWSTAQGGSMGAARDAGSSVRSFVSSPNYASIFAVAPQSSIIYQSISTPQGIYPFLSLVTQSPTDQFTTQPFRGLLNDFSISPTGQWMAVGCVSFDSTERWNDVCLVRLNGAQRGQVFPLNYTPEGDFDPRWVDNDTLLFIRHVNGLASIWEMDIDFTTMQGSTPRQVISMRSTAAVPVGDLIVFQGVENTLSLWETYVYDRSSAQTYRLTNNTDDLSSIAPDARLMTNGEVRIVWLSQYQSCQSAWEAACVLMMSDFNPDTATWTAPAVLPRETDGCQTLRFPHLSPDGLASKIMYQCQAVVGGSLYTYLEVMGIADDPDVNEPDIVYEREGYSVLIDTDWYESRLVDDSQATATVQAHATETQVAIVIQTNVALTETFQPTITPSATPRPLQGTQCSPNPNEWWWRVQRYNENNNLRPQYVDPSTGLSEALQAHHGVIDVWMKAIFGSVYSSENATTVLTPAPLHRLANSIQDTFRRTVVLPAGGWINVSWNDIKKLSNDAFNAIGTPQNCRDEFWRQFKEFAKRTICEAFINEYFTGELVLYAAREMALEFAIPLGSLAETLDFCEGIGVPII